jgi:hypothetical protein
MKRLLTRSFIAACAASLTMTSTFMLSACMTETKTMITTDTLFVTDTLRQVVGGPDSIRLARDGKPLEIRFYPRFGADTLKAGRKYRTAGGDSVSFSFARFYVSEIQLIDSLGAAHPLPGLYLVNALDSATEARGYATIITPAIPGSYRGVRFSIGVPFDLNHRDAAAQTAPLGTASGMFWSWNSGYIFNRTEGTVDSAGAQKSIAYHVGGDTRKMQVNLFSLTGTVSSLSVGAAGATVPVNVAYDALFSTGLNTAAPLRPSLNANERQAHGGALLDRIYLNTQSQFTLRN